MKRVRINGVVQTKFGLASLYDELNHQFSYTNERYFTYAELVDMCKRKGAKFD